MKLSPGTILRIDRLFEPDQRSTAASLLIEECGSNLPFLEMADEYDLERYRFAALKISGGNLDRLREAIDLANIDWRDLLVSAGFADDIHAHSRWLPEERPKTPS